jgi:hypothetical protein
MKAHDIAETVLDRVIDYCTRIYDQTLECMSNHNVEQLSIFIDAYLEDGDDEIEKAIQNSGEEFWKEIKEEYEKLWKENIVLRVSEKLGDILNMVMESIIQNDELNDNAKVRYLKRYDDILDKFGYEIKDALDHSRPLSKGVMRDWYRKIAKAFSIFNYDYCKQLSYILYYYDILDDSDQLNVLSILLDYIDDVLYDIQEKYIKNKGE